MGFLISSWIVHIATPSQPNSILPSVPTTLRWNECSWGFTVRPRHGTTWASNGYVWRCGVMLHPLTKSNIQQNPAILLLKISDGSCLEDVTHKKIWMLNEVTPLDSSFSLLIFVR